MSFLHGVEIVELNGGARPIETSSSSVIGLVGTAPIGPVNIPTVIAGSRKEAIEKFGGLGGDCSIPSALDSIFDQTGAVVVVINVLDPSMHSEEKPEADYKLVKGELILNDNYAYDVKITAADHPAEYVLGEDYHFDSASGLVTAIEGSPINTPETLKIAYTVVDPTKVSQDEIEGAVNQEGEYTGIQALMGAESVVHIAPRLLLAPGYTQIKSVTDSLIQVADKLRGIVIADGPGGTDSEAIDYRKSFDSARLYLVDPWVTVYDSKTKKESKKPASPYVAGVITKSDHERGFWWSPSNRPIRGISGTSRPIDFALGDKTARANLLNEQDVATIIRQDGYRLWGNHSCSSDPKWQFISVRRTADLINDALQRAHLWAIDRNINKTYIDDVTGSVNNYLRSLKAKGAIIDGNCWADPEMNTPAEIAAGRVYFDFDFTPPFPAEHITFRSSLVNDYLEEIFA
ncbi:hypothetical protein EDC56_1219 [Sinobacterium caligoides]|uniref:Tail sheath protein subtilisin-like domain-containing protein n=1 Tax=Sinobacterium caligoides TaxID=933926 RepID=A0A3N2E0N2_9GAMM|nr:phage tail sheath C-terminal domain-containing protein [Sinobacterium caligoides]ROS05673.1 hypothetical protein EDC56_1219 [Sinobacterium caligoides]